MIAPCFEEAFSKEWVQTQITDQTNELVILRQTIPWQRIIDRLVQFYNSEKGRIGKSLRIVVALVILSRLRQLSDGVVVQQVKENRYMQYFCNVPDERLGDFINPSTLCRFRQRLGQEGISIIEAEVFGCLRGAGVIQAETMLMDSTVLASNIVYPNDVQLLYKAFGKMEIFTRDHDLDLWWDQKLLKKLWRAFGRAKKGERASYLSQFYELFAPALDTFRSHVTVLGVSEGEISQAQGLVELLTLLDTQTQQKLAGELHIENRLVSLDEVDARPIKKGKSFPSCEFGTTAQMTFNRQGFMITTENFIGQPNDKTLYPGTLELFKERMSRYPELIVTDLGFRSQNNLKNNPDDISHVFLGRSDDVQEDKQDFCRKARSATEGFIAVAKNFRGFGKSLYRGLQGDRIWTLLNQTSYNLRKFLQLYRKGNIEEKNLLALKLLVA